MNSVNNQFYAEVAETLNGAEVSDVIRNALVEYRAGGNYWHGISVVTPDLVVSFSSRSEYGNSHGIGKFDEVRVWYKDQVSRQEWQWRDKYDASADRPDLRVGGIGEVTTKSEEGILKIRVEIKNGTSQRFATYIFEERDAQSQSTLSPEEQAAFEQRFNEEVERVFDSIKALMPLKPTMLLKGGASTYRQPSIKQRLLRANRGVGAFVTEEQIDHLGADRQIQFKLFVLNIGNLEARRLVEDSAYEQRDRVSPVITVLDLTPEKIVFNIRDENRTLSLA